MTKKVFIGVGHGGKDPGAVANGLRESDLTLSIAIACNTELLRHGIIVQMSRTKDEDDTVTEEVRESNAFNPDLAVDIHINAGGGDGAEIFYHYGGGTSKVLAQNVLDSIVAVGQNSRGIKTRVNKSGKDYYSFIRDTNAPAIIVECAFIDNKKDIQIIDTKAEQNSIGVAIAKGILKTLDINYKEEIPRTPCTGIVTGYNTPRQSDDLIIYTSGRSNTNQWGVDVLINSEGIVVNTPKYGECNLTVPAGGCILSGHGTAADWILTNINKGSRISNKIIVAM